MSLLLTCLLKPVDTSVVGEKHQQRRSDRLGYDVGWGGRLTKAKDLN